MKRYDLTEQQYVVAFATFQAAVARVSGQAAFANICRCSQGNISQLIRNKSLLPERYVLKVAAATHIPASQLRPDIYPSEQSSVLLPTEDDACSVAPATPSVACDRGAVLHRSAAR